MTLPDATSQYRIAGAADVLRLLDAGAGWTVDRFVGYTVEILSGAGAGQTRVISSNTVDVLTVTTAWTTLPDATSNYQIRETNLADKLFDTTKSWTTNVYAGTTVTITGGTGVGQVRTVVSNTNNRLTVTPAWATLPGATTTYRVGTGAVGELNKLYDFTQAWVPGSLVGFTVRITGGLGSGQTRTISANDATSVTVSVNWVTVPNTTSTYEITGLNNVLYDLDLPTPWATNQFAGYKLFISSGRGAGQTRTVSGNAARTLTVSAAWATIPDTTSVYQLSNEDYYTPYFAGGHVPPTYTQTVAALNARGIKVIVVDSSGGYAPALRDAREIATATGALGPTGAPLVYSISPSGTGLGTAVASAVADLASYSRLDITARANDNPATPFDERTLVASILAVAGSYAPGRCTGITGGVQFNQCLPGTGVTFQVNFTGVVMPTSVPQRFDFTIDTLGNGSQIISTTPVTIIIPPTSPAYPPSGTYTRDFDATMRCAGTEVPRWGNLSWTATLPTGTSISWTLRSATTTAALAAATPVTFSTPTLSSPQNAGSQLIAGGVPATLPHMRVTATLNSNAARSAAPTLSSFNLLYDCVAGE